MAKSKFFKSAVWQIAVLILSLFLTVALLIKATPISYTWLQTFLSPPLSVLAIIVSILLISLGGGFILLYYFIEKAILFCKIYGATLILGVVAYLFSIKIIVVCSAIVVWLIIGFFIWLVLGMISAAIAVPHDHGGP